MAGFRLAPKAARARRNPWQRRRRYFSVPPGDQSVAVGTATETDSAIALVYDVSIAVGTATESDSAITIVVDTDLGGSAIGAQGGLVWLFTNPPDTQIVAVGTATETDSAFALTVTVPSAQTVTVGTATETDSALALGVSIDQIIAVGTATELDSAFAVTLASTGIDLHWLLTRRRRTMSQVVKTYVRVLEKGTTRTSSFTSDTYEAETEAGILVTLDVTAASGTGGLSLRINAVDQASAQGVALNAAPVAVTAAGTYTYALYPFGAVAGNVTQATSFYLPRAFSISVSHADSSSYTYSLGYCLLP